MGYQQPGAASGASALALAATQHFGAQQLVGSAQGQQGDGPPPGQQGNQQPRVGHYQQPGAASGASALALAATQHFGAQQLVGSAQGQQGDGPPPGQPAARQSAASCGSLPAAWSSRGCERDGREPSELKSKALRKWDPSLAAKGSRPRLCRAAHPASCCCALSKGKGQAGQEKGDPGAAGLWNSIGVRRNVHSLGERFELAHGDAHACVLSEPHIILIRQICE